MYEGINANTNTVRIKNAGGDVCLEPDRVEYRKVISTKTCSTSNKQQWWELWQTNMGVLNGFTIRPCPPRAGSGISPVSGYRAPRRLAAGVEGTVCQLGDGIIAKVWDGRPPIDLGLTREVHADLARHRFPLATPEILDIAEHDGVQVGYERGLAGSPLRRDSAAMPPRPKTRRRRRWKPS